MFSALCPTLDDAIRFSEMALNICIIYACYVTPKTQLLHDAIWFGWLFHLNPLGYLFEVILANEFTGRTIKCAGSMIVPRGEGYDNFPQYQGCVISSGTLGNLNIPGDEFIEAQYSYTSAHLWAIPSKMTDLRNRIFTAYFVVMFPPAIINSAVPKFFENRMIWEARELSSRIYGWIQFYTTHAVAEIPSTVVTTVIYYLLEGVTNNNPILPVIFVVFGLFKDLIIPHRDVPDVFYYTLYYLSPCA
ncbi:hypothetical protein B9Z19DRAFT_1126916 [Tuber borchii]|uniref:ABC-2 type transporter-domain-containing protein n=1 Tax=Tuber borchii TaxID=42251 RepID=A0A2T6ZS74_TUBBO|nr:hypothetical protein B9Z19DRAFT_1126916 [Tuber borchii]